MITKKLEKLFEQHSAGLEQAITAAESRHSDKIAAGVLDRLENIRGDISRYITDILKQGKYAPSVQFEFKELLTKQRDQGKAFRAAIITKSFKEARTVLKWLLDIDKELVALI